jgi:hypothetical protein
MVGLKREGGVEAVEEDVSKVVAEVVFDERVIT